MKVIKKKKIRKKQNSDSILTIEQRMADQPAIQSNPEAESLLTPREGTRTRPGSGVSHARWVKQHQGFLTGPVLDEVFEKIYLVFVFLFVLQQN